MNKATRFLRCFYSLSDEFYITIYFYYSYLLLLTLELIELNIIVTMEPNVKTLKIQSFVFLDLETTGFPWQERNQTQITELAMVAVSRNTLLNTTAGTLPRVLQKLVLCFKPNREINSKVTEVTGLSNQLLADENAFNQAAFAMFNNFLSNQPAPACLVVHNGFKFDYPILSAHIHTSRQKLAKDVMCIDSIVMFREILKIPPVLVDIQNTVVDEWNVEIDETDLANIDSLEQQYSSSSEIECTPEKVSCSQVSSAPCSPVSSNVKGVKKAAKAKKIGPKLYNLKSIYEYLVGKEPIDAHRAENDCLLLLESCIARSAVIVDWCDSNKVPFSILPPMTSGKKFPNIQYKNKELFVLN